MIISTKIKSTLRSSARRCWMWYSEERKQCILNSKIGRGQYKCVLCKCTTNKIEIDHIIPAGKFSTFKEYGEWLERLFCPLSNLQALCKLCHLNKK